MVGRLFNKAKELARKAQLVPLVERAPGGSPESGKALAGAVVGGAKAKAVAEHYENTCADLSTVTWRKLQVQAAGSDGVKPVTKVVDAELKPSGVKRIYGTSEIDLMLPRNSAGGMHAVVDNVAVQVAPLTDKHGKVAGAGD